MIQEMSISNPVEVLSQEESETLERCSAVIENGKQAFIAVAKAIVTIKEGRLYRATHKTFDLYLQERHGFTRQYASLLMRSADAAEKLSTMVDIPTERVARQLSKLSDDDKITVAKRLANSTKPITARTVVEVSKPIIKARKESDRDKRIRDLREAIENGPRGGFRAIGMQAELAKLLAQDQPERDAEVIEPPQAPEPPTLTGKVALVADLELLRADCMGQKLGVDEIFDRVQELVHHHL